MPRIQPPGGEVDWPAEEGTLGVVGVAPWATLAFCQALYRQVDAAKDWHYPRVLLDINTKLPSRGRHLQLGETNPSPAIAATIRELARQGATLAVVVCNTAHLLHDQWATDAPIPLLHIVTQTLRHARAAGAHTVVPLVSASLAAADLYGTEARALGFACAQVDADDQRLVGELIEQVKTTGRLSPALQQQLEHLLRRLKADGVDTVIAGCTELTLLSAPCVAAGLQFVDSNEALARAALLQLGVPRNLLRPP